MKASSAKLALIPVGLVIVALLPKTVAYLTLKNELDNAIKRVQPLVSIDYRSLSTGYDGSVTLSGIEARLAEASESLQIDQIQLTGDNFLFPLRLSGMAQSHEFPRRMRLRVIGMEIPDLDKLVPPRMARMSPGLTELEQGWDSASCSFVNIARDVGFQQAVRTPGRLDLDLGYVYDPDAEAMDANYSISRTGIGSLSVLGHISGLPDPPALTSGSKPKLESAEVHHNIDPGYLRGKLASCAEQSHESLGDFVARLIVGPDSVLARETGWVLNDALAQTLSAYLLDPGEIALTMKPAPYLLTLPAAPSSPQEWVQLLGMSVTIKDQPVQDLSMRARGRPSSESTAPGGRQSDRRGNAGTESRRLTFGYAEVRPSALGRYIGRAVRVRTHTHAQALTGVLKKANANVAQIDNRVHGGHITMHVRVADMTRAEVYLRSDELEAAPHE